MPCRRGSRPSATGSAAGMSRAPRTNAVQAGRRHRREDPRHDERSRPSSGRTACAAGCPASSSGQGREPHLARASRPRPGRARGSTAGAASRRVPSGAGGRPTRGSGTGTRRTARRRSQPGAREGALEQIVAQERVLGDPPRQRLLERVDVVDALAGVAPLAEQVLVDVGDGGGVGIDAGRAGEDALEERGVTLGRERGRDARLEDAVPRDDPAAGGSSLGRFNGWAMVPTRRLTAPRGRRVSASSVTTYLTPAGGTRCGTRRT